MNNYEFSHELRDKVINYLSSRPYIEVYLLIQDLLRLKEMREAPDDLNKIEKKDAKN